MFGSAADAQWAAMLLSARGSRSLGCGSGQPKLAQTLSWLVDRTTQRHLGIPITGHQFRHILAKLILDEVAGGHELVKQSLGHQHMKTTTNYYAGLDTRRASRFQAALIEKIRAKKDRIPRPTRKRRRPSGRSQSKKGSRS